MHRPKMPRELIYHTVNVYVVPTHIETVRTDMPTKCNLFFLDKILKRPGNCWTVNKISLWSVN